MSTAPHPDTADERDEHQFAEFLQQMIGGRYEALAERMHPDIIWNLPPFAQQKPIHGINEVLQFLRDGASAVYQPDSLELEPEVLSVRDGKASCLATIRGQLVDGRPYENRYAFFARIAQGQIIEVWEILDSAMLLDQLKSAD